MFTEFVAVLGEGVGGGFGMDLEVKERYRLVQCRIENEFRLTQSVDSNSIRSENKT